MSGQELVHGQHGHPLKHALGVLLRLHNVGEDKVLLEALDLRLHLLPGKGVVDPVRSIPNVVPLYIFFSLFIGCCIKSQFWFSYK